MNSLPGRISPIRFWASVDEEIAAFEEIDAVLLELMHAADGEQEPVEAR
jgi:hypothetical protein